MWWLVGSLIFAVGMFRNESGEWPSEVVAVVAVVAVADVVRGDETYIAAAWGRQVDGRKGLWFRKAIAVLDALDLYAMEATK